MPAVSVRIRRMLRVVDDRTGGGNGRKSDVYYRYYSTQIDRLCKYKWSSLNAMAREVFHGGGDCRGEYTGDVEWKKKRSRQNVATSGVSGPKIR